MWGSKKPVERWYKRREAKVCTLPCILCKLKQEGTSGETSHQVEKRVNLDSLEVGSGRTNTKDAEWIDTRWGWRGRVGIDGEMLMGWMEKGLGLNRRGWDERKEVWMKSEGIVSDGGVGMCERGFWRIQMETEGESKAFEIRVRHWSSTDRNLRKIW